MTNLSVDVTDASYGETRRVAVTTEQQTVRTIYLIGGCGDRPLGVITVYGERLSYDR